MESCWPSDSRDMSLKAPLFPPTKLPRQRARLEVVAFGSANSGPPADNGSIFGRSSALARTSGISVTSVLHRTSQYLSHFRTSLSGLKRERAIIAGGLMGFPGMPDGPNVGRTGASPLRKKDAPAKDGMTALMLLLGCATRSDRRRKNPRGVPSPTAKRPELERGPTVLPPGVRPMNTSCRRHVTRLRERIPVAERHRYGGGAGGSAMKGCSGRVQDGIPSGGAAQSRRSRREHRRRRTGETLSETSSVCR